MARLTTRGTNPSSLFTADQADQWVARSRQSHTVRWRADVFRAGTATTALWEDLPIVGGELVIDSSADIRRRLNLEVAFHPDLIAEDENSVLVPFGQFVRLYVTIDTASGEFFPWLKMFEGPIRSYSQERPSMITTVECADWTAAVEDYQFEKERSFHGSRVGNAITALVNEALAARVTDVAPDIVASARTKVIANMVGEAGTGRWAACQAIADKHGYDVLLNSFGDLVVRNTLDDPFYGVAGDDPTITKNGPDIGTVSNPIAIIAEGTPEVPGSLVGTTATVSREDAANAVAINITGQLKKRDVKPGKKGAQPGTVDYFRLARAEVTSGPVTYGDSFGRVPNVFNVSIANPKTAVEWNQIQADYQRYAANLLNRRRGVIRYVDFDMLSGYELESDDAVKLQFGGRTEYHYLQSISFDLSGRRPTRCRCRSLNVLDPS